MHMRAIPTSYSPGLTDTYNKNIRRVLQLQSGSYRHIPGLTAPIRVLQTHTHTYVEQYPGLTVRVLQTHKKHTAVLTAPVRFLETHTGSYRLDPGLTDTYTYVCEQNPGLIALVLQTHTRYVIKIRVLQPGSYRHRKMYAGSYSPNPGLADTHTGSYSSNSALADTCTYTKTYVCEKTTGLTDT